MANSEDVKFQHDFIGNTGRTAAESAETFRRTEHPDAQWYPGAGLGMFIHWGIASVAGCLDLSWGMVKSPPGSAEKNVARYGLPARGLHVSPNHYWALAEKFTADRYDPDKWLRAAAAAGIKYCVMTTKHHDGFALWPSEYGDLSTKNYLGGRDLVGEYVAACRKNGLKVGFYYSPPDWRMDRDYMNFSRDPEHPVLGVDYTPVTLKEKTPEHEEELRRYRRGQIEELLTRYGKIDYLWFDGFGENCITFERIRELQPQIVVNDRGMLFGDVITIGSEGGMPKERRPGKWWEYCDVFADGAWGYLDYEVYKPAGWFLAELGKARSWDGNFLPNVAPDSHGELPPQYYKRMEQIGAWMKENSRAVYGVHGTHWPEKSNMPITVNGDTWFIHATWLCDYPIVVSDVEKPASLRLKGEDLPFRYENRTLTFEVPWHLKSNLTDVVELKFR